MTSRLLSTKITRCLLVSDMFFNMTHTRCRSGGAIITGCMLTAQLGVCVLAQQIVSTSNWSHWSSVYRKRVKPAYHSVHYHLHRVTEAWQKCLIGFERKTTQTWHFGCYHEYWQLGCHHLHLALCLNCCNLTNNIRLVLVMIDHYQLIYTYVLI